MTQPRETRPQPRRWLVCAFPRGQQASCCEGTYPAWNAHMAQVLALGDWHEREPNLDLSDCVVTVTEAN